MPHGGPDWGTPGPLKTVFTLEDMAELAARLGSIDTFDRRGNIIWMDSFEDGVEKWALDGDAGKGYEWDAAHPYSKGFCLKLWTGAVAWREAWVEQYLPYPVPSRMGFEVAFRLDEHLSEITFYYRLYSSATQYEATVKYDPALKAWYYYDSGGAWRKLSPDITLPVDRYNIMKLVADFTTGEFVRLISNDTAYDLSGKAMREFGGGGPYLSLFLDIVTKNAASSIAYFDNFIVTQNEP